MAENLDEETPGENSGAAAAGSPSIGPSIGTFDPATKDNPDDKTRRGISYWLLTLLTGLIIVSFIAIFIANGLAGDADDAAADADRLITLVNIVFGPVVTLVSSVVGFYFGARTARDSGG